jgi:DNA-binding transcriptional LysR family regulator
MIPFMVNSINAILVWHLSNIDMNLTHRQLTMFRAIMLHGNLGRAADACASSQPTLSRELGRLEQLLGFNLFDRVRGRLRPTVRALAL